LFFQIHLVLLQLPLAEPVFQEVQEASNVEQIEVEQ